MQSFLSLAWLMLAWSPEPSEQHGRMMEPPSRASMWRVGFPTPKNEDDNALYCGGFGVQHQQNGGRCGICGDPWDAFPRSNEAPHGIFATGIISKTYRQGSIIPVVVDLTANHQGQFTFKLCPNDDIWQDPGQRCFDGFPLATGREASPSHFITDEETGLRLVYVHLPHRVSCSQCILQWTYTAGNNWGLCSNGTGGLGCGPQETFRACSDIKILPSGLRSPPPSKIASFSDSTTFDLTEFEDYYDDMFTGEENLITDIDHSDYDDEDLEAETVPSLQTVRLKLLQKKLVLAEALDSLRQLISASQEDSEKEKISSSSKFSPSSLETVWSDQLDWSGSNSHGRRKRHSVL